MSKERALLKRALKFIVQSDELMDCDLTLYSEIRDLLAQPEQTEKEQELRVSVWLPFKEK
jgi:hypothetical protein